MTAALIAFAVLLFLIFLRVPIAFAMAIVGAVGFAALRGVEPALELIGQHARQTVLTSDLSVVPLFILMGNFVARSKLAEELYDAAHAFVGHYRGGLAMATILACGAFSSVCGSSLATAATMTNVSLGPMRRKGYAPSLAAASIAAGGTLGNLIPPGTVTVLYGIMTNTNIGHLFIASLLPGLLAVLLLIGAIAWATYFNPALGPADRRATWRERARALLKVWGLLVLFAVVMGGIYLGICTATEAAGIGAFGGFLFAWVKGTLTLRGLRDTLAATAITSSVLFFVLIGALILADFVTASGFSSATSDWLKSLHLPPLAVIGIIVVIYLLLGTALEGLSIVLLTVPIFYPIVTGFGLSPIWFGILVIVVTEISLISPPVGLNYSIISTMVPDIPEREIVKGLYPFLAAELILVAILTAFPSITLLLVPAKG
ncbi:MAG: TRAP transporter large permease [Alphaproteobacteria bacterium]